MTAGPAATVLIPTHDHGETLRYSVPTALGQTVRDIEVFILGDGVPDITREIAREFAASDPRVRFFDFAKGPGRGELHRHKVLQEARGEIVCYLFDDDLWLPDHIAVMQKLLRDADFAFTVPVVVRPDGAPSAAFVDLSRPLHRRLFTDPGSSTASVPTCAAHTMALYRRLPNGWRTTPRGCAPDKYMWAQCLASPSTVATSTSRSTAIIFPDPPRRSWPPSRRLAELAEWSCGLHDPAWKQRFLMDVSEALARDSARQLEVLLRLYALSLRFPFGGTWLRAVGRRLLEWDKRPGATTPPLD
ncbi:MAG: glycosyltransferase [Thermoanaerobaculia bacterium]|nr:glycosyltransferase [Thermoanaerobaculia bacterium]